MSGIRIVRDPDKAFAGSTHRRAFPSAKRSVSLQGHHPSTEYDWRESGNPFLRYLGNAQPWVVEAFLAVIKAQHRLGECDQPTLEDRERQLESEIMRAVSEVVSATHSAKASVGDKVDADQTLAELLAQRTAVRLELEKKRGQRRGH